MLEIKKNRNLLVPKPFALYGSAAFVIGLVGSVSALRINEPSSDTLQQNKISEVRQADAESEPAKLTASEKAVEGAVDPVNKPKEETVQSEVPPVPAESGSNSMNTYQKPAQTKEPEPQPQSAQPTHSSNSSPSAHRSEQTLLSPVESILEMTDL